MGVAFRAEVNGRDVTAKWRGRLLEIDVDDREGEASDSCTVTFDDQEPHIEWPPEGATLRLWLGTSEDQLVDMGTFTLDAPEASGPPDRLTVKGHAANFLAVGDKLPMQTHRSRAWTAVALGEMAATIARDHGLISRVQASLSGEIVDPIEQVDQSDLDFLSEVAKRYGARVRVKSAKGSLSGALEVVGAGPQLPQVVIGRADIEQWSAPFGSRVKEGTVVANWHNPKTGASGTRSAGTGDPKLVLVEVFETSSAAHSASKSRLKDTERAAAQLTVSLTTLNTAIASGTPVAVAGIRSEIDAVWNVVQVRHRAHSQSGRTTFTAERAV